MAIPGLNWMNFLGTLEATSRLQELGGGDRLENVACNLCGSARHRQVYAMPDRLYFREEFFTVVECDQCGLAFVNPRPTVAEMQKYYLPEYYLSPSTARPSRYLRRRFTEEANYLKELENGSGRKKLLDVGCANGDFPRFYGGARRGRGGRGDFGVVAANYGFSGAHAGVSGYSGERAHL